MFKKYFMIWAYKKPEMAFMPNTMLSLICRTTTDSPAEFQVKNPDYIPTLWYRLSRSEYKRVEALLELQRHKPKTESMSAEAATFFKDSVGNIISQEAMRR